MGKNMPITKSRDLQKKKKKKKEAFYIFLG